MKDIVYSSDEHHYYSDIETACIGVFEKSGIYEISQGESVRAEISEFVSARDIVDRIQESAYDEYDEFSEGYLDDFTEENEKNLEKVICDWFEERLFHPTFYRVFNVKKIKVKFDIENDEYEIIKPDYERHQVNNGTETIN